MRLGARAALAAAAVAVTFAGPAGAACTLGRIADLKVEMRGMAPLVSAQVNGRAGAFLVDSGAYTSIITPAGAKSFALKPHLAAEDAGLLGVGGLAQAQVGIADSFRFSGSAFHKVVFLLAPLPVDPGVSGVIGENVWRLGDVEYDLPDRQIRMFRPHDCATDSGLAYWAASTPVSEIELDATTPQYPVPQGRVFVDGLPLRAIFDTGAAASMISTAAAARLGVRATSPRSRAVRGVSGIGARVVPSFGAVFASVRIGDEEVRHPWLVVGSLDSLRTDMLVGADFFLAHRIYVATGRRRMYLTYVGGRVFAEPAQPPAASAAR